MSFQNLKTRFEKQLKARKEERLETRRRKGLLLESVRTHLVPALVQKGFGTATLGQSHQIDHKLTGTFPVGLLRRARLDGGVDLVEIQFKTFQRAAFRINACAVPKEGLMTAGGHRSGDELSAAGLHDHFETHARPWLRPVLRAVGLEPLGEWFSVWHSLLWPPTKADFDKLVCRAVAILPEVELALRDGELGPHMRRLEFKPLPPELLDRIRERKEARELEK